MVSGAPRLPCPRPQRVVLEGRYARLDPLSLAHAQDLFQASSGEGAIERFRYLFDEVPADLAAMCSWIERAAASDDLLFHAVIDRATGRACGRQALMRITPEHGVIEIGNILWGPSISRTRVATEALYLAARHVFDNLGYRRFEWKCHSANEPSKAAARRFGFTYEGLFRQHMWAKGANRDTVWFAMIDTDWPAVRAEFERWLDAGNFDADGTQRTRLKQQ
jgi:RimJ/RimL family protein N-acetyltransferase